MAKTGTPLYPFENPLHALALVAFGLVFFGIATLIRTAAKNSDGITELSRHNPWFVLFNKRSMTSEEANRYLPPFFWNIYGAFGAFAQFIGICVATLGGIAFLYALASKYF